MNLAFVLPLIAIALVALVWWVFRSVAKEFDGLGEDQHDDKAAGGGGKTPAQQLNDRKLMKEIERWRNGK